MFYCEVSILFVFANVFFLWNDNILVAFLRSVGYQIWFIFLYRECSLTSKVQKLRNSRNIMANFLVLSNLHCTNFDESDVKCWKYLSKATAYCFKSAKFWTELVQITENVCANVRQKQEFGQFCSCKNLRRSTGGMPSTKWCTVLVIRPHWSKQHCPALCLNGKQTMLEFCNF